MNRPAEFVTNFPKNPKVARLIHHNPEEWAREVKRLTEL
jgi:hypothetical protein